MEYLMLFCWPLISRFVTVVFKSPRQTRPNWSSIVWLQQPLQEMQLFIFSAVFHQTLSCGVDKPKWFSYVLTWLGPSLFLSLGPSHWIKLCKSVWNGACLVFFPSAALWLTFYGSNPLNLQHNGCHCTIALAPFHTQQLRSGETPCVQWVLVSLQAERALMTHTFRFSFLFNTTLLSSHCMNTLHVFTIWCEESYWHIFLCQ